MIVLLFHVPVHWLIFSVFSKFQKAALSSVICLSVHLERLGLHWTDFHEMRYFIIFWKYVKKIQVSLKPDKNIKITVPEDIYDNISLNSS